MPQKKNNDKSNEYNKNDKNVNNKITGKKRKYNQMSGNL